MSVAFIQSRRPAVLILMAHAFSESMTKPHAIIFSSGKSHPIAEAVKENLEMRGFTADTWKENFFDSNNTAPLNTFLKKLLCFDFAVLVLGDDDIRFDAASGTGVPIPRDNVIFELGAAMARMGTQKTFLITPSERRVVLPTYFKGLDPLTYEIRADGNHVAGTGTACTHIRNRINALDQDAFHSDLPALGLSYGYFFNFVRPIHETLLEPQRVMFAEGEDPWLPEHGFTLSIVIPEKLMNRRAADEFLHLEMHAANVHVQLKDGRDVSVYALSRKHAATPLHILDIPTTLLTSEKVIHRVDSFWGGGDRDFRERLTRRELATFGRRIRGLIEEEQLNQTKIRVIEIAGLAAHVAELTRN